MINIGIVIEKDKCAKIILKELQKIAEKAKIGVKFKIFKQEEEVFKLIEKNRLEIDICIITVDFKENNGISVGAKILEYNFNIKVIFLANNLNEIFECLDLGAYNYVLKNKEGLERLKKNFRKVLIQKNLIRGKSILVKKNGEIIDLRIRRIRYIEVINKNLNIHYDKSVLEITKSMTEIESVLKEYRFIRPHKSYLVNLYYIEQIRGKDIILTTKERIPVSRLRLKNVKGIFESFLENRSIIKNNKFI